MNKALRVASEPVQRKAEFRAGPSYPAVLLLNSPASPSRAGLGGGLLKAMQLHQMMPSPQSETHSVQRVVFCSVDPFFIPARPLSCQA